MVNFAILRGKVNLPVMMMINPVENGVLASVFPKVVYFPFILDQLQDGIIENPDPLEDMA